MCRLKRRKLRERGVRILAITLAFQAREAGSIPARRSNFLPKRYVDRDPSDCFQTINVLEQEFDLLWCACGVGEVSGIALPVTTHLAIKGPRAATKFQHIKGQDALRYFGKGTGLMVHKFLCFLATPEKHGH